MSSAIVDFRRPCSQDLRSLVVRPGAFSCVQDRAGEALVSFELPKGAYAMELVRELTKQPN